MNEAAIISTVRAPLDQLKRFIAFHLNVGFSHIILFFDDPYDGGIEKLSKLNRVDAIKCDELYWKKNCGSRPSSIEERQTTNVNEGVLIAKSKKCEWIVHIDSDELANPLKPLNEVLSSTDVDAIRFSVMEAVPSLENYDSIFEPRLFRKIPSRLSLSRAIKLATSLGCSSAFFGGEYFRGHIASKMAIRITDSIKSYGIHDALKHEGSLIVENVTEIQLLHYDCIGYTDWESKWDRRLDGSGNAVNMRRNREEQMTLYKKTKQEDNSQLSSLYRRLYFIPHYEKIILFSIGLLSYKYIDTGLFELPEGNKYI